MSAFIVDRKHIIYLTQYASRNEILPYLQMTPVEIANELAKENINSIHFLYPDTIEDVANVPGDPKTLEPFTQDDLDGRTWYKFYPVQVIKSCRCYEYQSCEHDGWATSKAKEIIERIVNRAINELEGMEDAIWGAPPPDYVKVKRNRKVLTTAE